MNANMNIIGFSEVSDDELVAVNGGQSPISIVSSHPDGTGSGSDGTKEPPRFEPPCFDCDPRLPTNSHR